MQWLRQASRFHSTAGVSKHYKLIVAGGGCGGCSVANRMADKLGKGNVCVVEPSEVHYYQPMWTLVGCGVKKFSQSACSMSSLLPSNADWVRSPVSRIEPDSNQVTLSNGDRLTYDYLVLALGVQLLYGRIEGALDALNNDPVVCSNYHPSFVLKTRPAFDLVSGGNAIFSFPNGPIKCPGAPQKIMYLLDDHLRKRGIRDGVRIMYNTSLPVIFGVKKYAAELTKVCERKAIQVNYRHNLVHVDRSRRRATFQNLDTNEMMELEYSFLHIAPPVGPRDCMAGSPLSLDGSGWVSVNPASLQHVKYPNVFALGDCANLPISKTAAAAGTQAAILTANLSEVMAGGSPDKAVYDGYTSCPLTTSYSTVIMAEFDYNLQPLETFPVDQGKERRSMFLLKTYILPHVYWHGLVRGRWAGPQRMRKLFNVFRWRRAEQPGN